MTDFAEITVKDARLAVTGRAWRTLYRLRANVARPFKKAARRMKKAVHRPILTTTRYE